MAYKTYIISVDNNPGIQQIEVKGRKVKIPGYEGFEFFVHRRYNAESHIPKRYSGWTVSEASTGWEVASEYFQKDAVTQARQRMRRVTPEEFQAKIDNAKKISGAIK